MRSQPPLIKYLEIKYLEKMGLTKEGVVWKGVVHSDPEELFCVLFDAFAKMVNNDEEGFFEIKGKGVWIKCEYTKVGVARGLKILEEVEKKIKEIRIIWIGKNLLCSDERFE